MQGYLNGNLNLSTTIGVNFPDYVAVIPAIPSSGYFFVVSQLQLPPASSSYIPTPIINLAEVEFFNGGTKISPASLSMTLSYNFFKPVFNCFDGNFNTYCETAYFDINPSLTVSLATGVSATRLVITNRFDSCQDRTVGATVKGYLNGNLYYSSTLATVSSSHSLVLPTPNPSATPTLLG